LVPGGFFFSTAMKNTFIEFKTTDGDPFFISPDQISAFYPGNMHDQTLFLVENEVFTIQGSITEVTQRIKEDSLVHNQMVRTEKRLQIMTTIQHPESYYKTAAMSKGMDIHSMTSVEVCYWTATMKAIEADIMMTVADECPETVVTDDMLTVFLTMHKD
jgi:hypothetical protein